MMVTTVWMMLPVFLPVADAAKGGAPTEICNCKDDDGDGLIDEGLKCEYKLAIEMTADDAYKTYLDGAGWGSDTDWTDIETYSAGVTAGVHHIAVYAYDTQDVVAGFLAAVSLDGTTIDLTDDASSGWMGSSSYPGTGWETTTAGLNNTVSATCTDWGTFWPASLLNQGADWVWEKDCSDPASYPENWYVLEVEVCLDALEVCNGIDDDGDGDIDEGFPDTDGDGIADCVDKEECDCVDNDGDGKVDEDLDCEYELELMITADDEYVAYIDGSFWGSDTDWTDIETYGAGVAAGTHHIGVYAYDVHGSVAGFISAVSVDGTVVDLTDDANSNWMGTSSNPGGGWETSTAGMNGTVSATCTAWGTFWPAGLLTLGADWVWEKDCSDPNTYPENWYVLELEVCPEAL